MKTKENVKELNFTRSTRSGISLIVLVITIIVIIILAAAIIISLNNNNPIMESNKARYESDRANIQAVFTNAVAKVMAKNQSTISISAGQINTITGGQKEVEGEVAYTLTYAQNVNNSTGKIVFDKKANTDTIFYTGKKLPIYAAGDTKWYVDKEGNISLEVAGTKYGNGEIIDGLNEYGFYFDRLYVFKETDVPNLGLIFYENGSAVWGFLDEDGALIEDESYELVEGHFTYEIGKILSDETPGGIVLNNGKQIEFDEVEGIKFIFNLFEVVPVANAPQVPAGAIPVKWDAEGNEIETTEDDPKWYNYKAQTSTTENGGTSKWANIKLQDGSYFVWIPRYAYKIDKANKTIDVKFTKYENGVDVAIDGSSLEGYIVHPAFKNDVAAGGWDKELSGFWASKYEAGGVDTNKGDIEVESNKVENTYLPVFKPQRTGCLIWQLGEAYLGAKEYNETLNSHMAKNSEWGAIMYLAHSQYGRNGTVIEPSNNGYMTGDGGTTTGNIYGIFDMSGSGFEYVAGYINNSARMAELYGTEMINDGEPNVSNKYKTVYDYNAENDTEIANYILLENSLRKGEGMWEITTITDEKITTWENVNINFFENERPFMFRGGIWSSLPPSIFEISSSQGHNYVSDGGILPTTFRMILIN